MKKQKAKRRNIYSQRSAKDGCAVHLMSKALNQILMHACALENKKMFNVALTL